MQRRRVLGQAGPDRRPAVVHAGGHEGRRQAGVVAAEGQGQIPVVDHGAPHRRVAVAADRLVVVPADEEALAAGEPGREPLLGQRQPQLRQEQPLPERPAVEAADDAGRRVPGGGGHRRQGGRRQHHVGVDEGQPLGAGALGAGQAGPGLAQPARRRVAVQPDDRGPRGSRHRPRRVGRPVVDHDHLGGLRRHRSHARGHDCGLVPGRDHHPHVDGRRRRVRAPGTGGRPTPCGPAPAEPRPPWRARTLTYEVYCRGRWMATSTSATGRPCTPPNRRPASWAAG